MAEAAVVAALRERIRALEGGPLVRRTRVPSGVEALDARIEGLPRPGVVELVGAEGTGRTRMAVAMAAAITRRRCGVAWIDAEGEFYPPAAMAHGIDPEHFLVIRPPARDAVGWAAEQTLRSGCFALVVVAVGAGMRSGPSLARAAEHGQCTALVVSRRPSRDLPADVRLAADAQTLVVVRDRATPGGSVPMPSWPAGQDPWSP